VNVFTKLVFYHRFGNLKSRICPVTLYSALIRYG